MKLRFKNLNMNRRQFLTTTVTGAAVTMAGCSGGSDDTNTPKNTESPPADSTETTSSPTVNASFVFSINAPETANLGESIIIQVEVENTGNRNGTWTGEIAITATRGPEPDSAQQWQRGTIELDVPAGESRSWESKEFTIDQPSVTYYRLNNGELHTIEVPGSKAPILDTVNLVSEWNSYGDTIENEISESEAGSPINISSRYWYWAENQSMEAFRQVKVFDDSNDRVGINSGVLEQITENSGWGSWESYLRFDTTDWGEGTYTAEVLIRDEQNEEVSEKGSVDFQLV